MSEETSAPPRNLILCCDGTGNQFGTAITNVVRIVQIADRSGDHQRLYYDPGVGTMPEPTLRTMRQRVENVLGLAFGYGMVENIEQAYCYLVDRWRPGDRVFLFGFSRGAYTVRVLAGILHAFGLLPRGASNLFPYLMRLFRSIDRQNTPEKDRARLYKQLCDQFRWTFARPTSEVNDERRFTIHFMGLWDTVSSVGWVWEPAKFPYTANNRSVVTIRHAIALDERRAFFRQNRMFKAPAAQDLQELWFPGVHSDVGGGYKGSTLWQSPFLWIVEEARKCGLRIDDDRLRKVLGERVERPWADKAHESLTTAWMPAELWPKVRYDAARRRNHLRLNFGRFRSVPPDAELDQSVLLRIRDPELRYTPKSLPEDVVERIRALNSVPLRATVENLRVSTIQ